LKESTIKKELHFDAAHRLTKHPGACSNLHGHRWKLEVWVQGPVDPSDGMVEDFGTISDAADELDHTAILNRDDPLAEFLRETDDGVSFVTLPGDPTSENLIDHLWSDIEERLRDGAKIQRMRLHETPGSSAERVAE